MAVYLYRKAAEQGDISAQNNLSILYENGQGVTQDYIQAYAWLSVAIANGSSDENTIARRDRIASRLSSEKLGKAQEISASYFKQYSGE
ncbi:Sel1 repeat protein [compost metagenome]